MLISFSVSNFRSIGAEQTLNLVASNKITDHPNHLVEIGQTGKSVVRAAVIYGANAAGKSNLVRAMAAAQGMLRENERRRTIIEPFRFNAELSVQPTSFEFRFLIENRVFIYGFDVKSQDIHAEWLSVMMPVNEERVIFERNQQGKTEPAKDVAALFPNDSEIENLLNALSALPLTPRQLFLNRVRALPENVQSKTLRAVIHWLTRDLLILLPGHRRPDILDLLSDNENFHRLAEEFLSSVGTGIRSLELATEEVDAEGLARTASGRILIPSRWEGLDDVRPNPDDPSRYFARKLFARHPVDASLAPLPFSEESDGTRQLLHLMPVLASLKTGAKVVVIDELDRSLHPLICWEFIRLFSETGSETHKQLIVTTHEVHLLNQELLRRDEYWFVEKDPAQQSQLISLSDFKIRNDLQIAKGYLHGRFGGIPVIGSMTEIEKLLGQAES